MKGTDAQTNGRTELSLFVVVCFCLFVIVVVVVVVMMVIWTEGGNHSVVCFPATIQVV